MATDYDPATRMLIQRSEALLVRSATVQAHAAATSRYLSALIRAIPPRGASLARLARSLRTQI
jgi:hypothetical protein